MEGMPPIEIIEIIIKYGALPVLIILVWVLWKKVDKHEVSIAKLNEEQKNDIRNHANEVKSLHQNTLNTLNRIADSLNQKI